MVLWKWLAMCCQWKGDQVTLLCTFCTQTLDFSVAAAVEWQVALTSEHYLSHCSIHMGSNHTDYMSHVPRKPVFRIFDQVKSNQSAFLRRQLES